MADGAVHLGNLELVFKIGNGPQTPDNDVSPPGRDVIYQKSGKCVNRDPLLIIKYLLDQLYPLIRAEERIFRRVPGNRYDDLVENSQGAPDNVQMPVRNRI